MAPNHRSEFDIAATERCERVLVTLLGDLGPWCDRVVLVGGLAPRYIVGSDPLAANPHVGTTDVDLVITLAVGESSETYATLYRNLIRSGFAVGKHSFQWQRIVDGVTVDVEFICETNEADPGAIYRPKQGTGSDFAAFNAPCAGLTARDCVEVPVTAERLDGGGLSTVRLRVAGVLIFTVLKLLAFQQRHHNKDSYDLVYTLKNHENGPRAAGEVAPGARCAPRNRSPMRLNLCGSGSSRRTTTPRLPMRTSWPTQTTTTTELAFTTKPSRLCASF